MECIPKSIILDKDDIIEAITGYLAECGHEENFIFTFEVKKNDTEHGDAYIISVRAEAEE